MQIPRRAITLSLGTNLWLPTTIKHRLIRIAGPSNLG